MLQEQNGAHVPVAVQHNAGAASQTCVEPSTSSYALSSKTAIVDFHLMLKIIFLSICAKAAMSMKHSMLTLSIDRASKLI